MYDPSSSKFSAPLSSRMPRKRKQSAKTREPFPKTPQPTDAPIYNVLTRLEAEKVVIQSNQAQILSMLTGMVSGISEMKRILLTPEIKILPLAIHEENMKPLPDPPPPTNAPVDNLTSLHTRSVAELHNQAQILSMLTGWVSDIKEMKRLITQPPEIKIMPFHVQEEIMKRLPVESLVRFRCVSKSYKSLIDSSKFIAAHKNQPKHLLAMYKEREVEDVKFVSFADDDSFPRLKYFPALPPSIRKPTIVGSSYGLLCLYCYRSQMAFIWNPCIRKSIAIDVPKQLYEHGADRMVLGFGVCPVTIDPKIVHITHLCHPEVRTSESKQQFGKFWKVDVYKLSSGKFTNLSSNLPSVSIRIQRTWTPTQVVVDSLIYWCAEEHREDGTTRNLLMSFDITEENFKEVDLPDSLVSLPPHYLSVFKLRESLVMLERYEDQDQHSYGVWKMDNGLFTNLFTIKAPCGSIMIRPLGFRNTGGPVMCVEGPTFCYSTQLVYEPNSKKHSNLLLSSYADTYFVESYMETLLLIGRSDSISTTF